MRRNAETMSQPDETTPLAGLRVVTFESRLAGPMADMIARQGGVPVAAPALREIPIEDNPAALQFAERLMAGEFDMVIFLTGVGTRYLSQAIETRTPREAWTAALGRLTVVVRGPKPLVPLREMKVRVDVQAPEPNTWHEVLGALDARGPLVDLRIAVQEYGKENPELIAGLEARGAIVTRVPVYRWALPEDTGPLRQGIAEVADGMVGAVLFTSAQQVEHMLVVAAEEGRDADLRSALASRTIVGSIGPTTSETLHEHGLPVDIEPEHPKMGPLIIALAEGWRQTGKAKRG
jgi:uroporphyrinogen-III synthase